MCIQKHVCTILVGEELDQFLDCTGAELESPQADRLKLVTPYESFLENYYIDKQARNQKYPNDSSSKGQNMKDTRIL